MAGISAQTAGIMQVEPEIVNWTYLTNQKTQLANGFSSSVSRLMKTHKPNTRKKTDVAFRMISGSFLKCIIKLLNETLCLIE